MRKRKASDKVSTLPVDSKKLKTEPTEIRRSSRSSRSKAQELIKEQVNISSDDDNSNDDFVPPSTSTNAKKPRKTKCTEVYHSSTNSSLKAKKLIKKPVSDSSSNDDDNSDEDFSQTPATTTGIIVTAVNSFLSDSSSSDSDDDKPLVHKKKQLSLPDKHTNEKSSDSSSCYFEQSKSPFSNGNKSNSTPDSFETIEKNILAGVSKLSDSENSDMEDVEPSESFVPTHLLFPSLTAQNDEKIETKSKSGKIKIDNKSKIKRKKYTINENKTSNELDVSELLAMGECQPSTVQTPKKISPGPSTSKQGVQVNSKNMKQVINDLRSNTNSPKPSENVNKKAKHSVKKGSNRKVLSDSEDGSDWEEVDHIDEKDVKHAIIPKEGVEITVQLPDILRKKKKKQFDVEAHIKRRINMIKRENQVLIHQVSLLSWLGHGIYVNTILNSPSLMGFALSLIPSQHCYPPKQIDLRYLEKITQWFKKNVVILNKSEPNDKTLQEILEECFHSKKAYNVRILVLLFVCMLRSLGIKTRLVLSLQPLPLKPKMEDLCSTLPKKEGNSTTSKKQDISATKTNIGSKAGKKPVEDNKNSQSKQKGTNSIKGSTVKSEKTSKYFPAKSTKDAKTATSESKIIKSKSISEKIFEKKSNLNSNGRSKTKISTSESPSKFSSPENKKTKTSSSSTKLNSSSNSPCTSSSSKKQAPNNSSNKSKEGKKKEDTTSSRHLRGRKPSKYRDDSSEESEPKEKTRKSNSKSKRSSQVTKLLSIKTESEDSDFEPEIICTKKSQSKNIDRKVLSSDEEVNIKASKSSKTKNGIDIWAEVFVEMEEKWICVDIPNGKVHCVSQLYSKATAPVRYVVAFGMDSSLRDVTRRYCPQFYTTTQKQRVDAKWWDSAIKPFYGHRSAFDREEEEDMDKQLQDRPLPASIGEYKKHPLYALKRHLLKFEALYPPEAATVGFIRGEAVYSRDCVFTLRSRETWMKEAKIVKPKEEPYKIVKSRPKYDRMTGQMMTDRPLEIFGPWQVEDYVPPPAVDGKVPRNEYGNVELFKPTMLPKGAVHLQIPGLSRIAKKLHIDCAPAMVGFDFHGGSTHPLFDGFVVCEEFKDILIDAHRQEEEEREKRNEEKRLKRIYGNWRKLINGLLIREKLKKKYSFGSEEQSGSSSKPAASSSKKVLFLKSKTKAETKNKKLKNSSESESE